MAEPQAPGPQPQDALARAALDTSVVVLQRQRRLEQELRSANEKLEGLVKDKVALLKEVHHRVKNNLQVITSLLRLEAGRSNQSDTKAVLGDMQARIRSMALLHESLYRRGDFAQVDLGAYLTQLSQQAFQSLAPKNGLVRLELDMEPLQVSLDQATPGGLLVNELISNSLKHGFPEGRGGTVRVTLAARSGTGRAYLQISDTGVGLPADFESRRTASLGLQLVSDLARQLGGELMVASTGGACFSLDFTVLEITLPGPASPSESHQSA